MTHCKDCTYWDRLGEKAYYTFSSNPYHGCNNSKLSGNILDGHIDGGDMLIYFSDDLYGHDELVTGENFGCIHGENKK